MEENENDTTLLNCPLSHTLMRDPVIASDGYTYEREMIEKWFETHDTSPMTNVKIYKLLIPNRGLRQIIDEYAADFPIAEVDRYKPSKTYPEIDQAAVLDQILRIKTATIIRNTGPTPQPFDQGDFLGHPTYHDLYSSMTRPEWRTERHEKTRERLRKKLETWKKRNTSKRSKSSKDSKPKRRYSPDRWRKSSKRSKPERRSWRSSKSSKGSRAKPRGEKSWRSSKSRAKSKRRRNRNRSPRSNKGSKDRWRLSKPGSRKKRWSKRS